MGFQYAPDTSGMDWPSRSWRDLQNGFSSDLVIRPALEDGLPIRGERHGESGAPCGWANPSYMPRVTSKSPVAKGQSQSVLYDDIACFSVCIRRVGISPGY